MAAAYSFVSRWRIPQPPEQVWAELERTLTGPSAATIPWWPELSIPMPPRRLAPGERMVLAVRSPLGYRLRVRLELTSVDAGRALAAASEGDLRGTGEVVIGGPAPEDRTGDPAGAGWCLVAFRWDVQTRRPWMNATAWLLRPLFERAHARVMRRGERGLQALWGSGAGSEPRNAGNPRPTGGRGGRAD
ncbi:SRPBCC family protein [Microbacterium timonense]|uniref:hypothetical protein n=1 Tax=Microbacterium timonense TaxID=2086576 RepID=UPI000D0ECD56|nr:hypothetical protein [Microbacterium timonense]